MFKSIIFMKNKLILPIIAVLISCKTDKPKKIQEEEDTENVFLTEWKGEYNSSAFDKMELSAKP